MENTGFQSRRKNDCVIVALSNAIGLSYDETIELVKSEVERNNFVWDLEEKGVPLGIFQDLACQYGYVNKAIPRRGQEKMTGLAVVRTPGNKKASLHAITIINGLVFDLSCNGMPIKEYRQRFVKNSICRYFVRG